MTEHLRAWKNHFLFSIKSYLLVSGFLIISIAGSPLYGQTTRTITGTVTSMSEAESLPGTMVLIKGTDKGVITDLEGKYSLEANEEDVLVFSFLGYVTEEIVVGNQSIVDITLIEDISELMEVVVIGYGVQEKKLVTGATGQMKGDDIVKLSATDAMQGLQGQVAGVNIASTSGQPGEGMKVTIRGAGTIGNSGPLYVVDGIQTGDISYLNNSDIESVDVLKDAAAAAIYGSQAANGVVLITTKTGKAGKTNLTFDSFYGIQEPANQISMLNSREYAVIMNEAAINIGKLPYFTMEEINSMDNGTDWIDEMIHNNAATQNYALGLNGGSENSIYSLSLSYTGQDGIIGGPGLSEYNRYAFRVNTEHNVLKDIVKIGQHLTFSYVDRNGIKVGNQYNNSFRSAFNTSPFLPMYDDDGNFLNNTSGRGVMYQGEEWVPWVEGESNPYATMQYDNQSKRNNQKLLGDVYVEINPISTLKFRSRFGVDFYTGESRSYAPIYELSIYNQRTFDQATQNMSKGLGLTWDNILSYDLDLKDHAFTFMGGVFMYQNNGNWLQTTNADLVFTGIDYAYIDNTTNTDFARISLGGGPNDESKLLSYLGRITYDYKQKYLLNATFRADGSSRFAKDNRWGYFPSVSAGWVITEESFMAPVENVLDFLKLRASWGQIGNQNIQAWQYLSPVSINESNYYFGSADYDASGNQVGAHIDRLSNEDVQWETSAHFHHLCTVDWYHL